VTTRRRERGCRAVGKTCPAPLRNSLRDHFAKLRGALAKWSRNLTPWYGTCCVVTTDHFAKN
jgi:hypothetical protein